MTGDDLAPVSDGAGEVDRLHGNGQPRMYAECARANPAGDDLHQACCRFPKSCSPFPYDETPVTDADLEPRRPAPTQAPQADETLAGDVEVLAEEMWRRAGGQSLAGWPEVTNVESWRTFARRIIASDWLATHVRTIRAEREDGEGDRGYEPADFYKVADLADWLHPRLEGRPFCAYSPKSMCPFTSASRSLADALLVEGGWIEGFMWHRLIATIRADAEQAAARDALVEAAGLADRYEKAAEALYPGGVSNLAKRAVYLRVRDDLRALLPEEPTS